MNTQTPSNVNFGQVYRVHSTNIGEKYFNYKHKEEIFRAAGALRDSIINNKLSSELMTKFCSLFEDYEGNPFVFVARTNGPRYQQDILVLTAEDAERYWTARQVEKNTDDDNTNSQWILKEMAQNAWRRKLRISTKECNGQLTITDIAKLDKNAKEKVK